MNWRDTVEGRSVISQFAFASVRGPRPSPGLTSLRPYRSARRVLAEWLSGQLQPEGVYLTNITQARLPELVHLVRARARIGEDLVRLRDECGLTDFEGRSFIGWHHHVTLASIAHAYRTAQRHGQSELADQLARPYA
jgi:SRSO17 transposase